MRDRNRIKPFMEEIAKFWEEECPDWRFGQLIENVYSTSTKDIFFLEENESLELFKKFFHKEEKMTVEDAKKNLKEIVKLAETEIEKNDENVHAILDLEDLKSLKIILDNIEK